MSRIEEIRQRLVQRELVEPAEVEDLTFSLSTGELADTRRQLSRRFLVSKRGVPFLSVRLLPKPWPFSVTDIVAIYQRYGSFEEFKVPRLLDHFDASDCDYFIEELVPSAVSLENLVQRGEVSSEEAADVVRGILVAIWKSGESPSEEFVAEQTSAMRRQFADFFHSATFGAFLLDSVEKSFATSEISWRHVLSSGDIIDRNILRSGDSWYLVDFEHAHSTLFFFKEACRSRMYSPWARDLPLTSLCPFFGELPEETLELVCLASEAHLCEQLLGPAALEAERERLRARLWDVLDSHFRERLDTRLRDAAQLRSSLERCADEQLALREKVQTLERRIVAQDSDAKRAVAEQLSLRADLELANQRIEGKNAELEEAQRLLRASREELSGLRAALATSRVEHQANLRTQTESFDAELQRQINLLQDRERQIDDIYRSRTWRLTLPLRWLSDGLRRFLGGAA